VNVEIMTLSGTANAWVKVGYGTDDDYWGVYNIGTAQSGNVGTPSTGWKTDDSDDDGAVLNFGRPLYFSAADTIDLVINQAITAGRIRVVVHLLEDDR
jgi:hypothetical protein